MEAPGQPPSLPSSKSDPAFSVGHICLTLMNIKTYLVRKEHKGHAVFVCCSFKNNKFGKMELLYGLLYSLMLLDSVLCTSFIHDD